MKNYNTYFVQKIMTANKKELTLILYDGAIKFCNMAKNELKNKNFENTNTYIKKVEDIIFYLQSTLNYDYPIAQDFNNIYKIINITLITANIKKDINELNKVLLYLREIRETWNLVMKTTT